MTSEEIMSEVMKDKVFYDNSGGGMTLSGGEPLLQYDFAMNLLKTAKSNGIHTCIETCGFAESEKIINISEYVDIFLYDWKLTDEKLHEEYTGVSNKLILENLKVLDNKGAKIIMRCPIIPKVNDNEEHFTGITNLANSLKNVIGIEIEPYHSLGNYKYDRLDYLKYNRDFEVPEDEQVNLWILQIQKNTKIPVKKS